MKKILIKIVKIYCLLLVTVLILVGLKNVRTPNQLVMPMLFIPIFGYISTSFSSKISKKIGAPILGISVLISLFLAVAEIFNARKINDLVIVVLSIPLPIILMVDLIEMAKKFKINKVDKKVIEKEVNEEIDESRRKFIKIAAGSTLATAVMFFLKRQKAGAAFFGSVPGPGTVSIKDSTGAKVDIAQKQPLDGYNISDIDTVSATHYYGFVNKDGAWYILQENTDSSIRYAKGANNYATAITGAWVTRASQTYGIFSDVF